MNTKRGKDKPRGSVYATVTVTVSVQLHQPWSGEETTGNIVASAARGALERMRRVCQDHGATMQVLDVNAEDVALRFKEVPND